MIFEAELFFYLKPVELRWVLHSYAVVDMLEFVVRNAVERRFENMNCAFSCNYQTLAVVGKVLYHFFLVCIGVVKNCVQVDHGN